MKLMPLILLFAACGDDAPATPRGCQPLLAGADCLLPYPSDYFGSPDPSGHRVAISDAAKIKDMHGYPVDPSSFWQAAGFSRVSMIVATLGAPVVHDGLVGILDDYTPSTMPSSRTILVNATSGEL